MNLIASGPSFSTNQANLKPTSLPTTSSSSTTKYKNEVDAAIERKQSS